MKKIPLVIIFFVLFCTMRAQDTVYPFTANYPIYCNTDAIHYVGNYFCGGENGAMVPMLIPDELWDTATRMWHMNRLVAVRYCLPPNTLTAVNGVAISYRFPSHRGSQITLHGVLVTFEGNDYEHPNIFRTTNCAVRGMTNNYHIALDYESDCGVLDTILDAYSFFFDSSIYVTDTFFVGLWLSTICPGAGLADEAVPMLVCLDENVSNQCQYCNSLYLYTTAMEDSSIIFTRMDNISKDTYFPFCPILSIPDTDSFYCPEVEGLAFAGMNAGYPTLLWDTAGEHELYQLAYGPYDAPVDSLRVVESRERFVELFDRTLSEDIYYQARLRARCHHRCPVHDTVMWTGWSEPVFFYTGDSIPDTTHQQPIGIAPVSARMAFVLAPNPTHGSVTLTLEEMPVAGTTLVMHDGAGREVLYKVLHERVTIIETDKLSAGVYTVTVSNPRGSATRRLSVE